MLVFGVGPLEEHRRWRPSAGGLCLALDGGGRRYLALGGAGRRCLALAAAPWRCRLLVGIGQRGPALADAAELSLKDSLSAVRNASQAAARIYQVFRMHSFHRKKFAEYGDDNTEISEEHAISLLTIKSQNSGLYDMPPHDAAIRIQNKFRGWKGRKEFLITRQRIVKIQVCCPLLITLLMHFVHMEILLLFLSHIFVVQICILHLHC